MKKKIGKQSKIPLTRPVFTTAEEREVINVLRSGWVAQGPAVMEFENRVKDYVGVDYAIATTSATTGLFLALYILGITTGDEVLTPAFTFIATANSIMETGATPIFVDIDPKTYNIDPLKIERSITSRTKAIMTVDQFGLSCDYDAIQRIAKKHKLFVVDDAACALGSIYKKKKIGSFCDIACFSFHPRKVITTGEGGMLLTNNAAIAKKARILRHHGMSVSDLTRHHAAHIIKESYTEVGFNFRMSDLQAAVGLAQMEKLSELLQKRKVIADFYTKAFGESETVFPPFVPEGMGHNWQSYVVRIRKGDPRRIMEKLLLDGIATRRGNLAIHKEEAYRKKYSLVSLPETEKAAEQTIALPIFPQMTREQQSYVATRLLYHAAAEIES